MVEMQKRSLQKLAMSNSKLSGVVDVHILQLGASLQDEYMAKEKNTAMVCIIEVRSSVISCG